MIMCKMLGAASSLSSHIFISPSLSHFAAAAAESSDAAAKKVPKKKKKDSTEAGVVSNPLFESMETALRRYTEDAGVANKGNSVSGVKVCP